MLGCWDKFEHIIWKLPERPPLGNYISEHLKRETIIESSTPQCTT